MKADQRLRAILSRLEGPIDETRARSILSAPTTVTLGEFLRAWLESDVRVRVAPSTLHGYDRICTRYLIPTLGYTRLVDLHRGEIEDVLHGMLMSAMAPLTVKNTRSVLSMACRAAVECNLISENPCSRVRLPRIRTAAPENRLSSTDVVSLIALVREDDLLEFCCTAALVLSLNLDEVLALKLGDFRAERALVSVERRVRRIPGQGIMEVGLGPRRQPRLVSLPRFVETALERQVARVSQMRLAAGKNWGDRDLVCPNAVGGYLDDRYIRRLFKRKASSAGFSRIQFRDLARAVRQPILVRMTECLQSARAHIPALLIEREAVDDR